MLAPVSLYRLVYRSKSRVEMHEQALAALLRQARLHNQTANLTGLLLYSRGRFLQVLEGPEPALSVLYARIQTDPQHQEVELLAYGPAPARAFPDWRMGFTSNDASFFKQLTGFLPLADAPGLTAHPSEELARLLRDFAQRRPQNQ